ncbi:MAG: metal-sensitive transcriptional regulator [Ignavibacteriae bacterium]|nr:metal-sensitive transcriptional regulator [Ignavibacteriota bacterium]
MLNHKEKKEIIKRLHYIRGQVNGIEKMMIDNRDIKDVHTQLKAVEQGLHQVIYSVLDDQLKKHFAEVLAKRLDECPGDCEDYDHLKFLRKEFGQLNLKEIINEITWLQNSTNPKINKNRKEVRIR